MLADSFNTVGPLFAFVLQNKSLKHGYNNVSSQKYFNSKVITIAWSDVTTWSHMVPATGQFLPGKTSLWRATSWSLNTISKIRLPIILTLSLPSHLKVFKPQEQYDGVSFESITFWILEGTTECTHCLAGFFNALLLLFGFFSLWSKISWSYLCLNLKCSWPQLVGRIERLSSSVPHCEEYFPLS